jgi:hypothetical protein
MTAAIMDPMPSNEPPVRYGANGQRLCHAKSRTTGGLCEAFAMSGQLVCRMHGGMIPQARNKAKLRLAELVDPAIGTLAREMATAQSSKDRMAAANSILDRAGWGRVSNVEVGDARDALIARLIALRDEYQTDSGPATIDAPPTVIEGTVDDRDTSEGA